MMMQCCIKFRPIRPASPHLNGKVERSQKTDLTEFYAIVDLDDGALPDRLLEWQHHNWHRPHGALGGRTPIDRYFEVPQQTPHSDAVEAAYEDSLERIQESEYRIDQKLRRW